MADGIFASPEVLDALDQALSRMASRMRDALEAIRGEADHQVQNLEDALRECESEIRRLREDLDGTEDPEEAEWVAVRIGEAHERRRALARSLGHVEAARESYLAQARRAHEIASERAQKAQAFLHRATEDLHGYLSEQPGAGISALPPPSQAGYTHALGMNLTAPGLPTFLPAATPALMAHAALAGGGRSSGTGGLPDRQTSRSNFAWLDPHDVPFPPDEGADLAWGRLSRDEAERALLAIQRLRSHVDLDGMVSPGQVRAQRDRIEAALNTKGDRFFSDYEVSLFDLFFGSEAIRLDVREGQFEIINGRHRLWVALVLGMHSVPVSLTAKAKQLLQHLIEEKGDR